MATENEPEVVLHVWPAKWDCPSINPDCLAAILFLQLTMPGQYVVQESVTPDMSPSGLLPYLTHGITAIASFPSIVSYVSRLHKQSDLNEDEDLIDQVQEVNSVQEAQRNAWIAYVQAQVGDILAYMFYGSQANFTQLTTPTIAGMLAVPGRYYVPARLRDSYESRLKAADLWTVPKDEKSKGKQEKNEKFKEAFMKEKVQEKARSIFTILSNLLGTDSFFLSHEPTALDAVVAAYSLLILKPPFPEDNVSVLLTSSFPELIGHAQRVFDIALHPSKPSRKVRPPEARSIMSLASLISWRPPKGGILKTQRKRRDTNEEKKYKKLRWQLYGAAAAAVVAWVVVLGMKLKLNVVVVGSEEKEEDDEEDDDIDEEEEDDEIDDDGEEEEMEGDSD